LKHFIPISRVGQTKGGRNLVYSVVAIQCQSTKSNLEQHVKENIMNSFKPVWISLAAMVLLSLASCNTSPPIPDNTQISSNPGVETRGMVKIHHYGPGGPGFHLVSTALYWEIIDIILAHGGVPSEENIDSVYDQISH
jgi:hypothetical protein